MLFLLEICYVKFNFFWDGLKVLSKVSCKSIEDDFGKDGRDGYLKCD